MKTEAPIISENTEGLYIINCTAAAVCTIGCVSCFDVYVYTHQHRTHRAKRAAHPMVHTAAAIQKTGGRDILHQKLINNDLIKGAIDNVCSAVQWIP
jgi:hypothetical protein